MANNQKVEHSSTMGKSATLEFTDRAISEARQGAVANPVFRITDGQRQALKKARPPK